MKKDAGKPKVNAPGRVVPSSGNVFADLKLPNPDERLTKVRLAVAVNALLQQKRLTQSQAAARLGINQPKVSALAGYKLDGFSVERLMRFLTALNRDVEIVIRMRPGNRRPGRVTVTAA